MLTFSRVYSSADELPAFPVYTIQLAVLELICMAASLNRTAPNSELDS